MNQGHSLGLLKTKCDKHCYFQVDVRIGGIPHFLIPGLRKICCVLTELAL